MTFHRHVLRGLLGLAGGILAAHAAAAQNLVVNGDFDTDLSGWQAGSPAPSWTMDDYRNSAVSGAARVRNDDAAANVRVYPLVQCVTPPPGPYTLRVRAFLPGGQAAGRLVASYGAYHGANCTGGLNALGGDFLGATDVWQQTTMSFQVVNLPGASALVMLGIEKDSAGGVLTGVYDGIELVSDVVFADAFEG